MLAAYRSITATADLILRASQIYADVPRGSWWDMHHIYQFICEKELQKKNEFPLIALLLSPNPWVTGSVLSWRGCSK